MQAYRDISLPIYFEIDFTPPEMTDQFLGETNHLLKEMGEPLELTEEFLKNCVLYILRNLTITKTLFSNADWYEFYNFKVHPNYHIQVKHFFQRFLVANFNQLFENIHILSSGTASLLVRIRYLEIVNKNWQPKVIEFYIYNRELE